MSQWGPSCPTGLVGTGPQASLSARLPKKGAGFETRCVKSDPKNRLAGDARGPGSRDAPLLSLQMSELFADASVGRMGTQILKVGVRSQLLHIMIAEIQGLFEFRSGQLEVTRPG